MARYLGPKRKKQRRFGLTNQSHSILSRKTLHGQRMEQKQKIKFLYGVMEKQFRRYIEKAQQNKINPINQLIQELERRLDNVVYRAGLAKTRPHARQLISHGLILINEKK